MKHIDHYDLITSYTMKRGTGMNVKKLCKYAEKSYVGKGYIKCQLDGSVRSNGCPCNKCELSWWQKFKQKIGW